MYLAPECEEIEVRINAIVCVSQTENTTEEELF